MAFEGGLPDCEVAAVAWPDSAQLTVGTWLAAGCDPAAVTGPACAADAATSRKQSEAVARAAASTRLFRFFISASPLIAGIALAGDHLNVTGGDGHDAAGQPNGRRGIPVVDEHEEPALPVGAPDDLQVARPGARLHRGGRRVEAGRGAGGGEHRRRGRGVGTGGNVPGAAFAQVVAGDRGTAGRRAAGVPGHRLGPG